MGVSKNEIAGQFLLMLKFLVVTMLLVGSGCVSFNRVVVQRDFTKPVGQELIDNHKAFAAGDLSEEAYAAEKAKLLQRFAPKNPKDLGNLSNLAVGLNSRQIE